MCQNQKTIIAKINTQICLVLESIKDVKFDLFSAQKIKKFNPDILIMFKKMESQFSTISYFDDQESDQWDIQNTFEENFDKKTYSQIIGSGQSHEENIFSNPESSQSIFDFGAQNDSTFRVMNFTRGPYRSYNTQEKLNVIRLFKEGKTYAFISRLLGIPQKNIVRWCKNGVYRKQGAGRKIGDAEMESKVIEWIQNVFQEGEEIKGRCIRSKAIEYSTKKEFKSSKGWLKNFIRRHSLSKRYVIV